MPPRHHGMAYQSAAQTFGHGNQFTKMKSSIMFNVKLQTSNIFKHLNGGLSQLYLYSWCIMIIMNYNMNSHQKSWHPIISPGYVWYSGHGARSETEGSQPGCSWAKMGTCPSVIGPFFYIFLVRETMAKIWVTLWSHGFWCLILGRKDCGLRSFWTGKDGTTTIWSLQPVRFCLLLGLVL